MSPDSVNSSLEAAVGAIAKSFGVPQDKAAIAASELEAALSRRIERTTLSRGGVADVVALLGDRNAGRAAQDERNLASPDVANAGNHVLDVLIGDKHISRGIAARAAKQSGLDVSVTKRMLPATASLLLGDLQRQAAPLLSEKLRAFPGIGDLLPMPDAAPSAPPPSASGEPAAPQENRLRKPIGAKPAAPPARGRNGGSVILPMPGELPPRQPGRTGYDELADDVRNGGGKAPAGGSLQQIIRQVLGQLLGFGNRGVLGSLIYLFLTRFALNFIRRILSRLFTGR